MADRNRAHRAALLHCRHQLALQVSLKAYASAVRWNDFETAYASTDPTLRATEGFTENDEAYYKRFQISGYSLKSSAFADPQTYNQRVELRIIDVASQTERTHIDRQSWRWDPAMRATPYARPPVRTPIRSATTQTATDSSTALSA